MRVHREPEVAVYQAGEGQGLLTARKAHFLLSERTFITKTICNITDIVSARGGALNLNSRTILRLSCM